MQIAVESQSEAIAVRLVRGETINRKDIPDLKEVLRHLTYFQSNTKDCIKQLKQAVGG